MKNKFSEIIGWYGVVAILVAYALVSFSVITAKGAIYQLLNLTGAIGIVVIALTKKDYHPAILNGIWAVIAVLSLFILIFK